MDFPFGETIVLHRMVAGGRDEYGATIRSATDVTFTQCPTWAGPSTERNDNQTQVVADRTVVLPHGTAVQPTDELTVLGLRYSVLGQPADDRSPFTGWAPGTVIELRRVGG